MTWKRKSGNIFIPDIHRHDRKQFFSRRWQHWCSFRLACLVMIAAHWIIWKIARQAAQCGIIMCKRKSLYFKVNARREHAYMRACVRTAYVRAYVRACVRAAVSACEPPLVSFHSVVSSSANVARFLLAIAHTESRSLEREADRLLVRRERVAWEKIYIVREGLNSLHIEYILYVQFVTIDKILILK